jgi:putative RNA 2'-phosphotransferase
MSDAIGASKFLSFVLRHRPGSIGLELDEAGWAEIDVLILLAQPQYPLSRALIDRAVAENDKNRFEIDADGRRIRARQGHSLDVDVGLTPVAPPTRLVLPVMITGRRPASSRPSAARG